ncbi:hypothetical protein [Flectobacillus major]|uniref:hypothetical protein n=1 Tax=Flectobacillus major TaxID=103 RepID=UPI0004297F20|nr:hypothetical protein [Flectobacillus major]
MKNITMLTLAFFAMLLSAKASLAQNTNMERELVAIMAQGGYAVSETLYADVKEGSSTFRWKTFYSQVNYMIVAFAEEDGVNDIDLYLYDGDNYLLSKSTSSNNYELLKYTPYSTRQLKVQVKNYDSYSSSYTYRLKFIIFYRN